MRLRRIEAGRYATEDGRFSVLNTYDPSGPPHVRFSGPKWRLTEGASGKVWRFYTLADVKWHLSEVYAKR